MTTPASALFDRLGLRTRLASACSVLLMSAALMGLSACGDKKAEPAAQASASQPKIKPSLAVELIAPSRGEWPVSVAANGSIAPWQEAIIGAQLSSLSVLEVKVNVGDYVRKGQVLATLRKDGLTAEVSATRSQLAEATAVLAEARSEAERARQLKSADAVSEAYAQRALTAEKQALARVGALKAQMSGSEIRMAQSTVVAPDDGLISMRSATVGSVIQPMPGQEMFRLIRHGRLEWRAEVQSTDLIRIKPGVPVKLSAASGPEVSGRVRMVAPTVDPTTRNGMVYVDIPAAAVAAGGIKSGMFAKGQLLVEDTKALTLPQSAVLMREGYSYVMRLDKDSKVMEVKVTVGRRQGDRVEVIDGITAQDKVIASGLAFLTDGDTVRVVDAGQKR